MMSGLVPLGQDIVNTFNTQNVDMTPQFRKDYKIDINNLVRKDHVDSYNLIFDQNVRKTIISYRENNNFLTIHVELKIPNNYSVPVENNRHSKVKYAFVLILVNLDGVLLNSVMTTNLLDNHRPYSIHWNNDGTKLYMYDHSHYIIFDAGLNVVKPLTFLAGKKKYSTDCKFVSCHKFGDGFYFYNSENHEEEIAKITLLKWDSYGFWISNDMFLYYVIYGIDRRPDNSVIYKTIFTTFNVITGETNEVLVLRGFMWTIKKSNTHYLIRVEENHNATIYLCNLNFEILYEKVGGGEIDLNNKYFSIRGNEYVDIYSVNTFQKIGKICYKFDKGPNNSKFTHDNLITVSKGTRFPSIGNSSIYADIIDVVIIN